MRLLALFLAVLATTPLQAADALYGRVVAIQDGDTLTLLTADRVEVRVRLAEIDCPERRQDWGARARQALADKVFRKSVEVSVVDVDRYGRIVGRIYLDGRDINRELVSEGHAWVHRQYMSDRSLLDEEAAARGAGRGLWGQGEPMPPWDYRRGSRSSSRSPRSTEAAPGEFSCGAKRYCREMRSCAEARFYLLQCGLNRLDGDGDGVPCEEICN